MKYDLVAFDFDGTLANTVPWFETIMDDVAEKYNFRKIEKHEREHLRNFDSRQILRYLGIPVWKMPGVVNHVRQLMEKTAPEVELFEGTDDALTRLHEAGIKLAVVSSNSLDNVRRVLGKELVWRFDYYECGASIFGKAAKLRRLRARSGVSKNRMILIGDEVRDMEAAKAASVCAGAVAWGYNCLDVLKSTQPEEVFLQVDDMPRKILKAFV